MATNSWKNGGVDHNWHTASNWTLNHVPVDGEDIVFGAVAWDCWVDSITAGIHNLDMTGYAGNFGCDSWTWFLLSNNPAVIKLSGNWDNFKGTIRYQNFSQNCLLTTNGVRIPDLNIDWTNKPIILQDDLHFQSGGYIAVGSNAQISPFYIDLNGHAIRGLNTAGRANISMNGRTIKVNGGTFSNCLFSSVVFDNGGNNLDLSSITGGAGDFGGNSNATAGKTVTFTTGANMYYYYTGDGGSSPTWCPWKDESVWFLGSGGSGGAGWCPLPQDTARFDENSFPNITTDWAVFGDSVSWFSGIDCTGINVGGTNKTMRLPSAPSDNYNFYGSVTLTDKVGVIGNLYMVSKLGGAYTLCVPDNGNQYNLKLVCIQTTGGSVTLQNDISIYGGLKVQYGTFDANDYNIIASYFNSSYSNTRAISMGNGSWTLNSYDSSNGDRVWDTTTTTGLTLTCEGSTINLPTTTRSDNHNVIFKGGGVTLNNVSISGAGDWIYNFKDSNHFGTITINRFTSNLNYVRTVKFENAKTQTITGLVANGSATNRIALVSVTNGVAYTLSMTSGTVNVNFCNIQDSTATGGGTFNAVAECVDVSGNTGWNFLNFHYNDTYDIVNDVNPDSLDTYVDGVLMMSRTSTKLISKKDISAEQDIVLASTSVIYFGGKTTEGSWRLRRVDNDLVYERYESSVWNEKDRVTA